MRILKAIKKYAKSNRTALTCDGENMSYKELDYVSEAIGYFLIKEMGQDSKPVVLYGNKENIMMAVMIGALKSGRAYIPIDISYPKERVDTIIHEVRPEILFDFSEGIYILFLGVFSLFFAEILKIATRMKEERDLTI